jgi:hypothetical protein
MFKWLKEKAKQAATNQCKLNIRLNTKTLVSVANRADENIRASSGNTNDGNISDVVSAQKSLLQDIVLGHSNGMSLADIRSNIIDPILSELEVSNGAKMAVDHVLKTASETVDIQGSNA